MRTKYVFWIAIILLTACRGGASKTYPYPEITQRQLEAKPAIQGDFGLVWQSTPESGKSVVRGKMILKDSSILVGELYLASAVPTNNSEVLLLELDQDKAPKAVIDRKTGRFVFLGIEPGIYGIIVWEPLNSFPVNDPRKEQTLYIKVQANNIIDLGEIPIP